MNTMLRVLLLVFFFAAIVQCKEKNTKNIISSVADLHLKKGVVIACGPPKQEFGTVVFETSCAQSVRGDFDEAVALLHSFEYDEAEKVFAKVIDQEPQCAMAYWGVAMSNFHTLWTPPTPDELKKGAKAIAIAQSLEGKSQREKDYIDAMAVFYKDVATNDHKTRSINFEAAMKELFLKYPADKEAAVFYALTLIANADPADKSFTRQLSAAGILENIYRDQPNHPGIIHYLIHAYDYPVIAEKALPEARRYASVAPSSAHAQHMPSHIFTRLGLWKECIKSNQDAAASALCYAQSTGVKGHWDEELHAIDYIMYGYLQQGDNDSAKKQWQYVDTLQQVWPQNFKVAYAFAAVPARYVLENKSWKEAADLKLRPENFPWSRFAWQKAIVHFARVLGAVHTGQLDSARNELKQLQAIRDSLLAQKDPYKANQVDIQIKTSEAWILFKEGKRDEALKTMTLAAEMEDNTEKHPVTPGEVLPARELLGDMLLEMDQPAKALLAYEADLVTHPNRFNGLYGAAVAADKTGNKEKATAYYRQLMEITGGKHSNRPELTAARRFLSATKSIAGK